MEEELVTITQKRHDELLRTELWRECLESGGVDNWDWYHDSLKDGGYWDDAE